MSESQNERKNLRVAMIFGNELAQLLDTIINIISSPSLD